MSIELFNATRTGGEMIDEVGKGEVPFNVVLFSSVQVLRCVIALLGLYFCCVRVYSGWVLRSEGRLFVLALCVGRLLHVSR